MATATSPLSGPLISSGRLFTSFQVREECAYSSRRAAGTGCSPNSSQHCYLSFQAQMEVKIDILWHVFNSQNQIVGLYWNVDGVLKVDVEEEYC